MNRIRFLHEADKKVDTKAQIRTRQLYVSSHYHSRHLQPRWHVDQDRRYAEMLILPLYMYRKISISQAYA